jgi:hypothetical protein
VLGPGGARVGGEGRQQVGLVAGAAVTTMGPAVPAGPPRPGSVRGPSGPGSGQGPPLEEAGHVGP